jgi:Ca2+-binding RTX toxin-like protein
VRPASIVGNDRLVGGPGNDRLLGGANVDLVIYTGATNGVDVDLGAGVATGEGNDVIDAKAVEGSPFGDMLTTGPGGWAMYGGGGEDLLQGGPGHEVLYGGSGNDVVRGEGGDDLLFGDTLTEGAETGNDALFAGPGQNQLYGGRGNDSLFPGTATWVVGDSGWTPRTSAMPPPG